MCFSQLSSLLALSVGICTSGAAYLYHYKVLSIFILIVSWVQFSEFLIWRGLDTNNHKMNQFGTSLTKTLIGLHGVAVCIAVFIFAMPKQSWRQYALIACTLLALTSYGIIVEAPYGQTTEAGCAVGCRLKWGFPDYSTSVSYAIGFAIIFIAFLLSNISLMQTFIIFAYYAITFWVCILTAKKNGLVEAISTTWCYVASIASPIVVATLVLGNIR